MKEIINNLFEIFYPKSNLKFTTKLLLILFVVFTIFMLLSTLK